MGLGVSKDNVKVTVRNHGTNVAHYSGQYSTKWQGSAAANIASADRCGEMKESVFWGCHLQ